MKIIIKDTSNKPTQFLFNNLVEEKNQAIQRSSVESPQPFKFPCCCHLQLYKGQICLFIMKYWAIKISSGETHWYNSRSVHGGRRSLLSHPGFAKFKFVWNRDLPLITLPPRCRGSGRLAGSEGLFQLLLFKKITLVLTGVEAQWCSLGSTSNQFYLYFKCRKIYLETTVFNFFKMFLAVSSFWDKSGRLQWEVILADCMQRQSGAFWQCKTILFWNDQI